MSLSKAGFAGASTWFESGGIEKGFVSPRLNVKFEIADELVMTAPDGWVFVEYRIVALREIEEKRRREIAEARAEEAARKQAAADERLDELMRKLQAHGIDPDALS